jgi:hypothetical protein
VLASNKSIQFIKLFRNQGLLMRKNIIALSVLCAAITPFALHAAGLFDSVKSLTGGTDQSASSNAGAVDPSVGQDALVSAYIAANRQVLMAESRMAKALGASEAAALAKAEADALSSGATADNLSKSDSAQSDVSKAIADRQNDTSIKMDAASKKEYAAGLGLLGKGMLQYVALTPKFSAFKSSLLTVSPLALTKLKAGAYLVQSFPGNSKNVYNTLSQAVSYSKGNDIPVPADATKAL